MPEQRMIPDPALPRSELDARLRALGHEFVSDVPRTHLRYRVLSWQHPDGSSVSLCEVHGLGERYLIRQGEPTEGFAAAIDAVPRDTIVRALAAASDPTRALPWLRRLCLLEHDTLSPELREHLTRALTGPDLLLRSAALSAALRLTRAHAVWALEQAAAVETHPELREMYRRTAEGERQKPE